MRDLIHAFRSLCRAPAFTTVAVLTLALGIGINTAVFSVAHGVFLQALPYPAPDRLLYVQGIYPGGQAGGFRYSDYQELLRHTPSLEALSTFVSTSGTMVALTDLPEPAQVRGNFVTPSHLELTGVRPLLGRVFRAEENSSPGGHPVAVLSYSTWQNALGGDPHIVGRTIHLNRLPVTVVGVTPAGFRDVAPADIWLPVMMLPPLLGAQYPSRTEFAGMALLKPGATLEQAQAEIRNVAASLEKAHPLTHRNFGITAFALGDVLRGELRRPSLVLSLSALLLLAISCANVGSLFLVHLTVRRREFAVRAALGASRGHLLRQLFAEASVIAVLGAAGGVVAAEALVRVFRAWVGTQLSPFITLGINADVLLFSVALLAAAVMGFGLLPALIGMRVDVREALQESRAAGRATARLRGAFVTAQLALSVVLLLGASLLVKSQQQMSSAAIGYRTENLLTFRLSLNTPRYESHAARAELVQQVTRRLRALPEVESAVHVGPSPLGDFSWLSYLVPEGRQPDDPLARYTVQTLIVEPGALSALGIPLLRGRDFTPQDTADRPRVAVVSKSLAETFWPGEDPIGKRYGGYLNPSANWITVIGVAADARHRRRFDLSDAAAGEAPGGLGPQRDHYFIHAQITTLTRAAFAVRTRSRNAPGVAQAIRAAVHSADPNLPIFDLRYLEDRLREQDSMPAAITALMTLFAGFALLLASTGLYGALAYATSQRTREIGIRMALGAQRGAVLALVARQGLWALAAGSALGLLGALALGRTMQSFLYGVSATDGQTLAATLLVLGVTAAVAVLVPARLATRIDPAAALRMD